MSNIQQFPLLSICTSVYNSGNKLYRFLDSLSNQTYENMEIIIIDDCSTDETTLKILEDLKTGKLTFNKKFKLIKNDTNLGILASFQKALNNASGEYFAFPESDDKLDYDFYEILMNKIYTTNSDVCRGLLLTYHENLEVSDKTYDKNEILVDESLLVDNKIVGFYNNQNKQRFQLMLDITHCWFYVFSKSILSYTNEKPQFFNAVLYGVSGYLFIDFKSSYITPDMASYYYYYSDYKEQTESGTKAKYKQYLNRCLSSFTQIINKTQTLLDKYAE